MTSEEKLANERSEKKSTRESGEPLDVGAEQEKGFRTNEGLQALQEMSKKEEREEYRLMHTSATRGVL